MNKRAVALAFLVVVGCGGKKDDPKDKPPAGSAAPGSAAAPAPEPTKPPAPPSPSGSAAPAAGAVVLTFPRDLPKVGDKQTKTETMTMQFPIAGKDLRMVKKSVETREVLEVTGEVFTKAKISYPTRTETQTADGKTKDKTSPLAGKSYLAALKDGVFEATHADGSPVPPDEMEELKKDNKRFGKPAVMDRIVATKSFKLGERLAFTAEELAEINKQGAESGRAETFTAIALTLTGVEANIATMRLEMAMQIKPKEGSLEMTLDGSMRVDATTGRPIQALGSGQLKGDMGVPINGTVSLETDYAY